MLTYKVIEDLMVIASPCTPYEKGWNDCGHQITDHIDAVEEELGELVGYSLVQVILQTNHFELNTEYGAGWNAYLHKLHRKIKEAACT